MHLTMSCPKLKCGGSRDVTYCLYVCKVGTKVKCPDYTRKYEVIKGIQLEEKYIVKYGEPDRPVPLVMRRRRRKKN